MGGPPVVTGSAVGSDVTSRWHEACGYEAPQRTTLTPLTQYKSQRPNGAAYDNSQGWLVPE